MQVRVCTVSPFCPAVRLLPERDEVLFQQILFIIYSRNAIIVQRSGISGQDAAWSFMTYLECQSLLGKSLKLLPPAVRF